MSEPKVVHEWGGPIWRGRVLEDGEVQTQGPTSAFPWATQQDGLIVSELARLAARVAHLETLASERADEIDRLRGALEQIGNDPISFDEQHGTHDETRWRKCQEIARAALRGEGESDG